MASLFETFTSALKKAGSKIKTEVGLFNEAAADTGSKIYDNTQETVQ